MDWGFLGGLGEGLQTVGKNLMEQDAEKRRTMMAQRLEEDREKRREAAELRKVDKTEFREMPVGGESILQKVFINSNGDVLRTEMPSAAEIQDYNSGRKRLSLQDTLLEAQVGEYQRKAARGKTVDERDDAVFDAAGGVAGEAQRKRIQGGQETSAAQRLQADTSIQNALTRGSRSSDGDDEDEALSPMQALYGILGGAENKYMQGDNALTPAEVEDAVSTVDNAIKQKYAENRGTGSTPPTRDVIRKLLLLELDRRYKNKSGAGSSATPTIKLASQQG